MKYIPNIYSWSLFLVTSVRPHPVQAESVFTGMKNDEHVAHTNLILNIFSIDKTACLRLGDKAPSSAHAPESIRLD
jgi:hypothetical protein